MNEDFIIVGHLVGVPLLCWTSCLDQLHPWKQKILKTASQGYKHIYKWMNFIPASHCSTKWHKMKYKIQNSSKNLTQCFAFVSHVVMQVFFSCSRKYNTTRATVRPPDSPARSTVFLPRPKHGSARYCAGLGGQPDAQGRAMPSANLWEAAHGQRLPRPGPLRPPAVVMPYPAPHYPAPSLHRPQRRAAAAALHSQRVALLRHRPPWYTQIRGKFTSFFHQQKYCSHKIHFFWSPMLVLYVVD